MIKLARVFSDNMVLQCGQEIAVWGTSDAESEISVLLNGDEICRAKVPEGEFRLMLPAQEPMCDAQLTVGDFVVKGVDIGEVWVAAGQSNMEFLLKYVKDIDEELSSADDLHLRMYTVGQYSFKGQRELGYKAWNPWDRWIKYGENGTDAFSAVAVFFAKKLRTKGVPVGIINCSWGGTKACAWTDKQLLTGELKISIEDFEKNCAALNMKKYEIIKQYVWPARFAQPAPGSNYSEMIMKNTFRPKEMMKIMEGLYSPQNSQENGNENANEMTSPFAPLEEMIGETISAADFMAVGPGNENEPGTLYDNMVSEIAGYSTRGVLWYQGCSDEDHADMYDQMFDAVVRCWRGSWKAVNPAQERMPFVFVQLAPYGTWMMNSNAAYPTLRESQERAYHNIPDVYMTSITDLGNVFDIHPKEKKPVGERMYLLADKYVYGNMDVYADSPIGKSVERTSDDTIEICFENGDNLHLVSQDFAGYNGFTVEEIKEEDPSLVPPVLDGINALTVLANGQPIQDAQCSISDHILTVKSAELHGVQDIVVQFARTGFYKVNLYNKAELPVRPFEISI